jgi:hypothetical protein
MRTTVTPELRAAVIKRDGDCMAPRLGGTSMDCFGRLRLEHVQDGGGRMGVRAESDMAHLVTLCSGHTEDGMRGGYVWCTDRRNRDAMRRYLREWADATGYLSASA